MCCVCAQCRLPAGGGGCIAYAMSKLRVFATAKKATAALDRASEKVLAARRVGEPGHPEVKVYTRSLTWCPEAIQRALQASRCHFTKVRLEFENQDSLEDFLQDGKNLHERFLSGGEDFPGRGWPGLRHSSSQHRLNRSRSRLALLPGSRGVVEASAAATASAMIVRPSTGTDALLSGGNVNPGTGCDWSCRPRHGISASGS